MNSILYKSGNVKITKINKNTKITSLQSFGTPGVFMRYHILKNKKYMIDISAYKKASCDVRLWIAEGNKIIYFLKNNILNESPTKIINFSIDCIY